jgi:hypothetical protein
VVVGGNGAATCAEWYEGVVYSIRGDNSLMILLCWFFSLGLYCRSTWYVGALAELHSRSTPCTCIDTGPGASHTACISCRGSWYSTGLSIG